MRFIISSVCFCRSLTLVKFNLFVTKNISVISKFILQAVTVTCGNLGALYDSYNN